MHNDIDDYGALLSFIGVTPFHEKFRFQSWIVSPIMKKQPRSLERFKELVRATCLRRMKKSAMASVDLRDPVEKVETITLYKHDQDIHDFFKREAGIIARKSRQERGRGKKSMSSSDGKILSFMNFMRLICNHGQDLLPWSAVELLTNHDTGSETWNTTLEANTTCYFCGEMVDSSAALSSQLGDNKENTTVCQACDNSRDTDIKVWNIDQATNDEKASIAVTSENTKVKAIIGRPSAKVDSLLRNICMEQFQAAGERPIKRYVWYNMAQKQEPRPYVL